MPALPSDLRNKLERAIIDARDRAEEGAKAALEAMAVHHHEPYPHQSPEERRLRNHLRAHARQLGDRQDSKDRLQISHLAHECAYEHWHRMIFARFLAENDLLIEPTHGVAMSLAECKELADKEKVDLWVYASRCAQQMLPQIFRPDDPLLQVTLAREHRLKLEAILSGLPSEVFNADDSLGWVYQFWQSDKKEKVNKSGEKITGDTLPAVTQLFTEHYMVLFLLHNTIGAWHAGKVLAANPKLAETAKDEDELRRAVALKAAGGYSFDYLRFVRGADGKGGPWRPAAGVFEGWPKKAAELKALDPCCGSGHFLVAIFELLFRLRMEEEELSLAAAVDAVLKDNIFGLELDARCTQIAAFNLAMAAWKASTHHPLPQLHIACSGLAPYTTEEEWVKLAGKDTRLRAGMERIYQLFQKAPELGSLINPHALGGDMLIAEFHELQPLLARALSGGGEDAIQHELTVAAQGITKAAEILSAHFHLVSTNVPYLGRGKQDDSLKSYCERMHPKAKADIATCFVERCIDFCNASGHTALVTPQNWLFLSRYAPLRTELLSSHAWECVARLGPRAFESIGGEVVSVALLAIARRNPDKHHAVVGFDAESFQTAPDKAHALASECKPMHRDIADILKKPEAAIVFSGHGSGSTMEDFADTWQGIVSCDDNRFIFKFWEVDASCDKWQWLQHPPQETALYTAKSALIRWDKGQGPLHNDSRAHNFPPPQALGRPAVAMQRTGDLQAALMFGEIFGDAVAPIFPKDPAHLAAIWSYAESGEFSRHVRIADKQIKTAVGSFLKVPFDINHWTSVAAEKYPKGLPAPLSIDPTQWIFEGHPKSASDPLQTAISRLLGYRWPRQTGSSFPDCPTLKPDGLEKFADNDGIVCIPSVRGEEPAASRLASLLAACGIKPDRDLDKWLRDGFFEEHCKLFHHRPFIWHIWDGRSRDGFHALVNYHKLAEGDGKGRKLLESLTYSYLGEWINRQNDGVKNGEEGAEDRLAAATELQKRLVAILEGEPPFDIFVRWKPIHQQPIGWEPDINDGVRLNIRPFLADDIPGGRTGAGILRWKPNIKWEKDRGKEPHRPKDEFPWFWEGDKFTGDRINDFHLKNEQKSKSRGKNVKHK